MNWYIKVLENYFNFKGRARRKEYWMFVLINMIVAIVIAVGSTLLDMKWLSTVYQFLVFIFLVLKLLIFLDFFLDRFLHFSPLSFLFIS